MVTLINFSPEDSPALNGYITDNGAGYSTEQGYGWVTQSSLDSENPTPIDISNNTRDRGSNSDLTEDTLIHLQYPNNLVSPIAQTSIKTPAAWEYDIANGSYYVTVGVGDSEFTDSSHTVNVEGESAISGFVPTEDSLFAEATTLVEVTDGRLTIDAVGGDNSKLTFLEIIPESDFEGEEDADSQTPVAEDDGDDSDSDDSDSSEGVEEDADSQTPIAEDDGDDSDSDDSDSSEGAEEDADSGIGGETPVNSDDDSDSGDFDSNGETIRINFSPASAFAPEGYIQDIGSGYSEARGSGWITQDSVGSDNPVPIDLSPNTRDRNAVQEDTFDSLIHLQYADAFDNQNSIKTPAAWEYELANGEYTVTVSVGDPDFIDSSHVINVEGNSVINGFVPTEDQLFAVETTTVEVTDGKLTIDAIGGFNTKLNFVEITPGSSSESANTPINVTPIESPTEVPIPVEGGGVVEIVQPVEGGVNINFGTASANLSSGFAQDVGAAYSDSRGYGWVTQDSAGSDNPSPVDVYANARDRNTLFNDGQGGSFQEPVRDSLIHLQYPTGLGNSDSAVTSPVAWEHAIENGQYEVTVGVGDPDFFDSNHVINVEGESVISGFVPTGSVENGFLPLDGQAFSSGTAIVEVTDGRLTVDAIGGENTKINYISIVEVTDV